MEILVDREWVNSELSRDASCPVIAASVARAVCRLLSEDSALLEAFAHERSLTHRLAIYLECEFPNFHVDCEYNRDGHDPKRVLLPCRRTDSYAIEAVTVFPDIAVHRRNSDDNHLVIEVKKNTSYPGKDIQKLTAYKIELRYRHALFLRFSRNGLIEVKWVA